MRLRLEDMCFLHQPVHQGQMRFSKGLLDEADHEDVALHIHVFAQPESFFRNAESKLLNLFRLAREGAAKLPSGFDVETHGCKTMRLYAVGEVVEAASVGDFSRVDATGDVLNFIGHFVPFAMCFFGTGVWRSADGMTIDDKRVEVYHIDMAVEEAHDTFTGNAGWNGRHCSEK